jgi:hypothetical protein
MFLLLAGTGVVVAGLVGTFLLTRMRANAHIDMLKAQLLDAADEGATVRVTSSQYARVPAPVRRYFRHVLQDDQLFVATARLSQTGTFRSVTDEPGDWSPFRATQVVTTRPPGFLWDAAIDMIPWASVRVLDAYVEGDGHLRARMGNALTVMKPSSSPALNEGELLRYLAEAPLYPTALLPEMGVHWTPIDDRSARATIADRGTTVSLIFHFNDRDEVDRVTGWRPFLRTDGVPESRPWTGRWRAYARRDGMCVPTKGEVAWGAPAYEETYWRGDIDEVTYTFCVLKAPFVDSGASSLRTRLSGRDGGRVN